MQGGPGSSAELDQAFAQLISQNQSSSSSSSAGFHNSSLHHGAVSHPGILPTSSSDLAWNQLAHQQGYHPLYILQHQTPMIPPNLFSNLSHNNLIPILVPVPSGSGGGWGLSSALHPQSVQQPTASEPDAAAPVPLSTSSPSGTEVDPADGEQSSIAEEKRRRNTAASGESREDKFGPSTTINECFVVLFRIKKKQRTINLERSVSELTGRADELEKEVADLRRENGWLKEIVMLKSTRNAAQQRQALSEAIQSANIDLNSDGRPQASTSSSVPSPPKTITVAEKPSSDDESATDEYPKTDKKGKGVRNRF